jgi:hypothetical protein
VENEFEKIDRLMELYLRYSDRVRSEAERLDQLELDDLEVISLLSFSYFDVFILSLNLFMN